MGWKNILIKISSKFLRIRMLATFHQSRAAIARLFTSRKRINSHVTSRRSIGWLTSAVETLKRGGLPKVRQVGDPVLRQTAAPVEKMCLTSKEFQKFSDLLVHVLRMHPACAVSAPQLGVSLQMFAIEFTGADLKKAIDTYGGKGVRDMGMYLFPLQVLCNPTLTIIDPTQVAMKEGCLSVDGFSAMVPRAKEVRIDAMDMKGEPISIEARGWIARLFQHELDHFQGNLFIDRMHYRTLANERWNEFKE